MSRGFVSNLALLWERFKSLWTLAENLTPKEAAELISVVQGLEARELTPRHVIDLFAEINHPEDIEYLKLTHKKFGQALKRRHILPQGASTALDNIEIFFNLGLLDAPSEKNIYRNWGTFAQEGEDLILSRMLGPSGFYVDVGAHHPFRFSNTALLYDLGWNGITIEPNPDGHAALKKFRPRDIALNVAILNQSQSQKQDQTFYMFEEPALNSFDKKYAEEMQSKGFPLQKQVQLPSKTLVEVFSEHAMDKKIDLLSVDCEGVDLEVLQSNDWTRWIPKVVVAEVIRQKNGKTSATGPVEEFLLSKGYSPFASLFNSIIWIHSSNK